MARNFNLLPILSIIVIGGLSAIPNVAMAKKDAHVAGKSLECWYDSKPGSGKWKYYYCGNQSRGCAGKNGKGKNDKHNTLYHGESFTFDSSPTDTYWCCGGSTEQRGRFVMDKGFSGGFYDESKTVTTKKDLGNGTYCNQMTKYTVCDETVFFDCNEPDDCQPGYIKRTEESVKIVRHLFSKSKTTSSETFSCVKPCENGMAFESPDSENCIACPSTQYQGIVYPNPSYKENSANKEEKNRFTTTANLFGYCVKCDPDTSFFNKKTKECVLKEDFKQKGKDVMKKCWKCAAKGTKEESGQTVNLFEECLKNDAADTYINSNCSFYNNSGS